MGTFLVGTMTTSNGWETESVPDALAKHITYWFQSRRNQGKVMGKVPSFYFLIKQYGQDPDRLVEQTRTELEQYIKELFPNCSVSVSQENLTGQVNQYRLIIAVRVVNDGVGYDLANAVLITGEQYKLLDAARL
jgi:hypothetical protein